MLKSIKNVEIVNKKVLLRLDLNVPLHDQEIRSDFRISKSIPTILHLLKKNNDVIILSHLGRPEEGRVTHNLSLREIADSLSEKLNQKVKFIIPTGGNRIGISTITGPSVSPTMFGVSGGSIDAVSYTHLTLPTKA